MIETQDLNRWVVAPIPTKYPIHPFRTPSDMSYLPSQKCENYANSREDHMSVLGTRLDNPHLSQPVCWSGFYMKKCIPSIRDIKPLFPKEITNLIAVTTVVEVFYLPPGC
jgi:hypothetical protein